MSILPRVAPENSGKPLKPQTKKSLSPGSPGEGINCIAHIAMYGSPVMNCGLESGVHSARKSMGRKKTINPPDKKLCELRGRGLSLRQIGKLTGQNKNRVSYILQKPENRELVRFYVENRAAILAEKQAEILSSIGHEDIKSASMLQKTTAFGILFDKERLERNQATEIVDVRAMVANLDNCIKELRGLLGEDADIIDISDSKV